MKITVRLYETVLYTGSRIVLPVNASCPCFLPLGCILGITLILLLMFAEELLVCLSADLLRPGACLVITTLREHLLCFI